MPLRNLLVRVGSDTSGLTRGLNNARSEVKKFADTISGAMGGVKGKIAKALALIGGAEFIKQGIDDASQYEAAMATLGATFGKSTQQFNDWAATTGKAMGFSRLESAKLAQTLSLNFRTIATSQEDLVAKTTKMEEVAALISNKRGMAMTEVSDRIRSAFNQEADGADELGVNVRVAALQQSEAYKKMANGKPWQQLSTATQKQILYSSILEQVTATLGSTMQDTTALRMAQFTASLGDVRLALGQAFLPILYVALPILTTLMNWLYSALQVFSAFMTALFGGFRFGAGNAVQIGGINAATDATKQQTQAVNNLGKAHQATAKKAKAAGQAAKDAAKLGVAGFDEVNTLADKTAKTAGAGAGGAGAGGAPAMPATGTPSLPSPDLSGFIEGVNKLVEYFKAKLAPIKAFFKGIWDEISIYFLRVVAKLSIWWFEWGDKFVQALKNAWAIVGTIIAPIIAFLVTFVWDSIKGLIDGLIKFFEGLIEFFTGIFTGDWGAVWQGLVDMIVGAFMVFWNFMNLTLVGGIRKLFVDLAAHGLEVVVEWILGMRGSFEGFISKLVANFFEMIGSIRRFISDFGSWLYSDAVSIAHNVMSAWDRIGSVGNSIWNAIKSAFYGAANWFSRYVISPIINGFDNIRQGFSRGVSSGLSAVWDQIKNAINDTIGAFNSVKNAMHLPIRDVPRLAAGGIAYGPTLAVVGEGRGPEAIAPIDKLQAYVANAVAVAMQANGGANQGSGEIVLTIDGRRLARIVKPYLDYENKRIGTNVRMNTI